MSNENMVRITGLRFYPSDVRSYKVDLHKVTSESLYKITIYFYDGSKATVLGFRDVIDEMDKIFNI